jgi:O-antigen/teichoic acid export membrane protein
MLSLSIPQFAGTILSIFSTSVVTLIVIAKLGAVANAHYYLAAQVAAAPTLFIWSISRLLVVEVSHEPSEQRRHLLQSAVAMGVVLVVGMGVGITFAHPILSIFGSAYASQGTTLLRLLLLALPGTVVASTYAALAWIDGRVWFLMIREAGSILVYLAIVLYLINHDGINSVGYAALVTSGVELVLFLPVTVQRIRAMKVVKPAVS